MSEENLIFTAWGFYVSLAIRGNTDGSFHMEWIHTLIFTIQRVQKKKPGFLSMLLILKQCWQKLSLFKKKKQKKNHLFSLIILIF